MPKKKRSTYRVEMRPEGGGKHPDDPNRELVRVMHVFADSEAAAREYATEAAMSEADATGDDIYQIVNVKKA